MIKEYVYKQATEISDYTLPMLDIFLQTHL